MKRGLTAILCSLVAMATSACVDLKKPEAVAVCAKAGTCGNQGDAFVVPPQPDGGTLDDLLVPPDSTIDSHDPTDAPALTDGTDQSDGSERADGPEPSETKPDGAVDSPADGPDPSIDGGDPEVMAGTCWTTKGPVAAGTVCRPSVGPCDVPEVCDGINPTCPADKFAMGDTICREAIGDCDLVESCTGASPECPADELRSPGAICRVSAGPCDVAESCSGTTPECPEDAMAPALTVCRVSTDANLCDPAETCTGSDPACPVDTLYAKPAKPTSVKVEPGVLQATISWAVVEGASGYNVKRSDVSKSGYTIQGAPPTAKTSPYVNTGLTGGSTYYYVVTAINAIPSCESDASDEASTTPTGSCVPPPVPILVATPKNGQIVLAWSGSADASSYVVARSTTSGTGYASIVVVVNGMSYTDLSVTDGTTYYYVVRASNESCSSLDSNEVSSSPICTPPAPPARLVATPSNGSVALSWTASTGAVSYRILRSTVAGSDYTLVGTSGTTSYTDTSVTNGVTYHYVVTASNGTCLSANSKEVPALPACSPPSIPASVTAKGGNTEIVLAWKPSSGGAVSYEVSRATSAGGPYTSVGKPTSAGYTDTDLINGTTYYYVVTASNGACSSTASAEVAAAPVCTPPGVPAGVKATPGDGRVSLSWTPSSNGPTSYTVSRAEGAGTYVVLGTPIATSFTDNSAVNGHTYSYVVSASNGTCSSGNSTAVTATPVAICIQPAPTGLTATAASQKVTLNWTAADGAMDYSISRSATSGSGYASVGTVTAPTTTFVDTDTSLKIGSTYYYVVTANNETCSSPNSTEASATVTCTPPTTPTGLSASADTSDGSVTLSWSTVDNATGYTISRSTTATGTYTDISSNQTAVTYKDAGCASGSTCYYKVRSSNVGGTCLSTSSTPVSADACRMPGVPSGLNKVVGAPTPGSGKVTLTWTASSNANSYEILRSTTAGGTYASVGTSDSASFTDSGLSDDTSYYYVLRARNGGASCASANSTEIMAIPRACQVLPGRVDGISPFNTTGPYCFVTCSNPPAGGWTCWNFGGRRITVNGTDVACSAALPAMRNGAYTFSISGGDSPYAGMNWTQGPRYDCP